MLSGIDLNENECRISDQTELPLRLLSPSPSFPHSHNKSREIERGTSSHSYTNLSLVHCGPDSNDVLAAHTGKL